MIDQVTTDERKAWADPLFQKYAFLYGVAQRLASGNDQELTRLIDLVGHMLKLQIFSREETEAEYERLRVKCEAVEAKHQHRIEATERIDQFFLEQLPTCPVCGGAWQKDEGYWFCEGEHDKNRLIRLDGKTVNRIITPLGRVLTDKGEEAIRVYLSENFVMTMNRERAKDFWMGKRFSELHYESNVIVLPAELAEERQSILEDLAELKASRLELATLAKRIAEAGAQLKSGKPIKLTFFDEDGKSVATVGESRYYAEYAQKYPVAGETWICTLEKGRRKNTCRMLFKVEGTADQSEVDELKEIIRKTYPGLPETIFSL